MSTIRLRLDSVSLPVLQTVLTECAKQRDAVSTNLAWGPDFAPQVHCGGRNADGMLYSIYTPPLSSHGALAVMIAADEADRAAARVAP